MLHVIVGYCVVGLMVAFGLGFVIFVHELGHFVVAKLCGVKCEKFYLGFDIAGLKFCKVQWGETEYGIGILPLGGYVKMLGQEDNPAALRKEIERAERTYDRSFEHYLDKVFSELGSGKRLILGVSDNVPVDANLDRLDRVTERVKAFGPVVPAPEGEL